MSLPRPLLWFSIAFLLGIALGGLVSMPPSVWLFLGGALLALGLLWYFIARSLEMQALSANLAYAAACLLLLCLGAARYQAAVPAFDAFDLAWYNDREYDLLITGWVAEPPDRRDTYANLRLSVTGVDTGNGDDIPVEGFLLARVDPNDAYTYGDLLRLRGRLKTPTENEDFSYREYLARQNIHAYMSSANVTPLPGEAGNPLTAWMYVFKEKALATLHRLFPDPEASLLAGILLGVDSGLPRDLQQAFKDTGTSHIIAISGFNIAIIAGLFLALFGRAFGERRGAVFAAFGIGFYTLLVGADAAVVRAAIMGTLGLLARHFGRRQDGLVTLFAVAVIMSLFNPFYLQDVGFQLSFAATLGLILYAQPLEQFTVRLLMKYTGTQGAMYTHTQVDTYPGTHATRNTELTTPLPNPRIAQTASLISNIFLLTLAAQITTLPIMAYHFNRLSLISFVANPFILPAQPSVMILGGLAGLLGMAFEPLGQAAAFIAWPFVTYTIRVVDLFARVPGAAFSVNFPLWALFAWYAALLGLTFGRYPLMEFYRTLKLRFPKIPAWAALTGLSILAILIWRAAFAIPDGKLHLTFLNAGSSDAILIQTPSGGTVLVNGGESLSQLSSQLGQRLPLFHRRLDWLVVASTQENQVAALPRLMERYPPDRVLWTGNVEASYSARSLDIWLADHSVPVTLAEAGQTLDLGDGATLKVLTSGPRGAVLLVEHRRFRALLPVGASFDSLDELKFGEEVGPLSLLLLADSGFAQLNPPEWLAYLEPQLVVLSVAAGDFNGLPDEQTLEAVAGRSLLRTDFNGWIQITSDGESIQVEVERGTLAPTPTPAPTPTLTEEPIPTEPPTEEPLPTP